MSCCPKPDRRRFIKITGGGIAGLYQLINSGLFISEARAARQPPQNDPIDHFVPVHKKLDPAWLRSLVAKGTRRPYIEEELETIGMPCGGICAGQLYVRGDGTLAHWRIANDTYNTGFGANPVSNTAVGSYPQNYTTFRPFSPIEQGFAISVKTADNDKIVRRLDRHGFDNIRFFGEYPVATIEYDVKQAQPLPVTVRAEVFSPFLPLNDKDSGLPATVLRYRVTNTSQAPVKVTLTGWLENPVFMNQRGRMPARVRNKVKRGHGLTSVIMDAVQAPDHTLPKRRTTVFENFESGNFDNWTVEGNAFGERPATGVLPDQKPIPIPFDGEWDRSLKDWEGRFFANSFHGGIAAKGRLVSRSFNIQEPYIVFRVGGGMSPTQTGIRLVIDGKPVRSDTGSVFDLVLHQRFWNVSEFIGKDAHLEIYDESDLQNVGQINIDEIVFSNRPPLEDEIFSTDHSQYGNVALSALNGNGASADAGTVESLLAILERDRSMRKHSERSRALGDSLIGAVTSDLSLAPGETGEAVFLITWFFPNLAVGTGGMGMSLPGEPVIDGERVGNAYANWFDSARAVADYIADDFDRLAGATFRFRDTYFDSTLPYWFLQRVGMPLSTLATETCQHWANGRFWAWEGVGCCPGTCDHVWNYAHGHARLFPALERSVREHQDLDETMDPETGEVMARGSLPEEMPNVNAMDGQAGVVLKAYRDHLLSPDENYLRRNWARIKLAMAWLLVQDGNEDGILEGKQHNTYDIDFFGANTMVGSLYLAALRAGEEMARIMGEPGYADNLRQVFKRGRDNTLKRLWNGEYFEQDVDLEEHPLFQYGDGCLADQLFGQSWAHQLGLGYLYPEDKTRTALKSIWKYNWAPDVASQNTVHAPMRVFAEPGEGGLFTCTWPKSRHFGDTAVRYKNEIWTGIEYQVASHMLYEGMLQEGLAIVRAVHDRYNGVKHNPWNEIECGDHYGRALASWGCLLAISGFNCDAPARRIVFAPKLTPEDFKTFFSAAEGWGSYTQQRGEGSQQCEIQLQSGSLEVREIELELPENNLEPQLTVTIEGQTIAATQRVQGKRVVAEFDKTATLHADDRLKIALVW